MGTKKEKGRELTPEEKFFQDYPDAPYLLRVKDTLLLAHTESKANDLARMAGCEVEKIYKPIIKTSAEDAAS